VIIDDNESVRKLLDKITNSRLGGLRQRLIALRTRFDDVGARAAAAAPALAASIVPDELLLADLRATASDFDVLRHAIVDEFAGFPNMPDAATLSTLKALDVALTAMERLQTEQAQSWEVARDEALGVLERVMRLVNCEGPELPHLAECQAQARQLHGAFADAPSGDVARLGAHLRPFVELITLTEGYNRLDDGECVALIDGIAQNFGRPLALAALRGKLVQESEAVAAEAVQSSARLGRKVEQR
jgi:hypothetical protein